MIATKRLTAAEDIYDASGRRLGRVASGMVDGRPRPYWSAEDTAGCRYHGLRSRQDAIATLEAVTDLRAQDAERAARRAAQENAARATDPVWQESLRRAGVRGSKQP